MWCHATLLKLLPSYARTQAAAAFKVPLFSTSPMQNRLLQVVERLAIPGVRRLIVVQPETRRVNAVISLSDVANFLFRNPME